MIDLQSESWRQLRVFGADAVTFLQGQLTQDLLQQETGWTLLLHPDGSVLTAARFARLPEGIALDLPSSVAERAVTRLKRFILRVDVALEIGDHVTVDAAELVARRWPGGPEAARDLPPHTYGRWVVDQCVSFTKGCFTGQELVGRADARGATMPWRFCGGQTLDLEGVDASLKATGPDGPQGVSSFLKVESGWAWRGFIHRTAIEGRADLEFVA